MGRPYPFGVFEVASREAQLDGSAAERYDQEQREMGVKLDFERMGLVPLQHVVANLKGHSIDSRRCSSSSGKLTG